MSTHSQIPSSRPPGNGQRHGSAIAELGPLGHMTKRTKIILSCLVVLAVFMVVSVFQQLRGFDASKEDPQKLFMFYVRNPIPRDVSVQSAVGHANFGGTFIKFRLKLSGKALDDLIAVKQLRSADSLQPYSFDERIIGVEASRVLLDRQR